jgi:hypothetical protein
MELFKNMLKNYLKIAWRNYMQIANISFDRFRDDSDFDRLDYR